MSGPQHTTCVPPGDYEDTGLGIAGLGKVGDILGFALDGWWELADYLLHRKLVCLGSLVPPGGTDVARLTRSHEAGDSRAIGRVVSFEPPSTKSFPDSIDNDFSFNILLRPDEAVLNFTQPQLDFISENPFVGGSWFKNAAGVERTDAERSAAVEDGYQGEFVTQQTDTPHPHEAGLGEWYSGTSVLMFYDAAKDATGTVTGVNAGGRGTAPTLSVSFADGTVQAYPLTAPGTFTVPVLHCECEGSRISDVFKAVDQLPIGGKGCRKNFFTRLVCTVLHIVFFPLTTLLVEEAWRNATDGNYHDALDGNGELSLGDLVLVTGRWVFDAGHTGWNEIHAVKFIQKIPPRQGTTQSPLRPAGPEPEPPAGEFAPFYTVWHNLSSEAPPDHAPGVPPTGMTPAQAAIYQAQQRPENQYVFHPDVDGCASQRRPVLDRVEPNEVGKRLGDRDIVVFGQGFAQGAIVTVTGPDLPVKATTVQSSNRIVVTLALTGDTPTGHRDVVVTNPDAGRGSCQGCLVIVDEPIVR